MIANRLLAATLVTACWMTNATAATAQGQETYEPRIESLQHPDGLRVTLPKEKPCDFAYCLKIHLPKK